MKCSQLEEGLISDHIKELQVQIYELITNGTGSEDTEVSEQEADEGGRGVVYKRGAGLQVTSVAGGVEILVREILLAHRVLSDKLETLRKHVNLFV